MTIFLGFWSAGEKLAMGWIGVFDLGGGRAEKTEEEGLEVGFEAIRSSSRIDAFVRVLLGWGRD